MVCPSAIAKALSLDDATRKYEILNRDRCEKSRRRGRDNRTDPLRATQVLAETSCLEGGRAGRLWANQAFALGMLSSIAW